MTAERTCANRGCPVRFTVAATGRPRLYCSDACRVAAHRRKAKAAKRPAYFMGGSDEWATPSELFAELDAEFGFTLDVCATPDNAKCDRYFTRDDDALARRWEGTCWMNPPYGREVGRWVAKAHDTALAGSTVVCLLPVRSDVRWWHQHVQGLPPEDVRMLPGRVRFNGGKTGAPFPSCVVVFRSPFRNDAGTDETSHETPPVEVPRP